MRYCNDIMIEKIFMKPVRGTQYFTSQGGVRTEGIIRVRERLLLLYTVE